MKLALKFIAVLIFLTQSAYAISIIRDAEIENVLREIADPIFIAAGLEPSVVKIYIVNDPTINAYVSGGSNVFINTGLLELSENPEVVIGVIAHETGHISGGHLLRSAAEYKNISLKTTLGYIAGLAAAAAGSPQAGVAIAAGTGHAAQRQLLKHTRTHEEAADQAALIFLEKTQQSPEGLLQLLKILYSKEAILHGEVNPYVRTHPLNQERISHIQSYMNSSKFAERGTNERIKQDFKRSIIKLKAFLRNPDKTLRIYKDQKSINAKYAQAIAHYKKPDLQRSLAKIDALIASSPANPFFHELKGQVLFEMGQVVESIPNYQKALELLPQSNLLRVILATAQISSNDPKMRKKAIRNLRKATLKESNNIFAWKQLAIAYGKDGNLGASNLASAEAAVLSKNIRETKRYIKEAKKHIKKDTPSYQRILDIESLVKSLKKK